MKKRVIIVHGWGGNPDEGRFPWLKKELRKQGFTVSAPSMPKPLEPRIDTWVPFLAQQIGTTDKHTYLFGHSIGCQTILRYLETLAKDATIGGAVFLAPWLGLTEEAYETEEDKIIAKPWLETPIDWDTVRLRCKKFVAIFSDNDPLVPSRDSEIFKKELKAKIIVEHKKGHFSGSDGIKELPSALDALVSIVKEEQ